MNSGILCQFVCWFFQVTSALARMPRLLLSLCLVSLWGLQASAALPRLQPHHFAHRYFQVEHTHGTTCQPMTAKNNYCAGFGYNSTITPNMLFMDQSDATSQLRGFDALIESHCSPELPFLLCSLYFPMCSMPKVRTSSSPSSLHRHGDIVRRPGEDVQMATPCRSLCERVKRGCFPVLENFGYSWPHDLNCSVLQSDSVALGPHGEISVCFDHAKHSYEPRLQAGGEFLARFYCEIQSLRQQ